MVAAERSGQALVGRLGLLLGPLVGAGVFASVPGLDPPGRMTAALAGWMAVWWLTEALPIAATALLPILVLPLAGLELGAVVEPYAHPFIFLFLGGFLVALSMERWGLHRRIALTTLRVFGVRPPAVVGGFMLATALLSMWMSNTATAVMMLPIAVSVIDLLADREGGERLSEGGGLPPGARHFAICLLLGVAYGASIGGIGTIVGTPPNLFLVSYVRESTGTEIGFVRWLGIGIPLVAVMLPLAWWLLVRVLYPIELAALPGGRGHLRRELAGLGTLSRGEKVTLVVFLLMAAGWLTRPLLAELSIAGVRPFENLSDTGIALGAALLLFALPAGGGRRTLDWETARRVPWGILLLFGGGLSLAAALDDTGVTGLIGSQVGGLRDLPEPLLVVCVTAVVVFLTEVTSNTATTAAFVPILGGVAEGLGLHPFALIIPATLAASCAFMMPVATPPNAVIFGSGHVTIPQMARAGVWLNLVGIGVVSALTWWVALPLFGVELVP